MSSISDAITGNSNRGLSSILAQLNALLTPTEQLPGSPTSRALLLGLNSLPATRQAAATPGLNGTAPAPSQPSTMSSILQGLSKARGPISKIAQSLMGTPISAADAATWASGAPANSAVSQALGGTGNVANDGTAASVQAANDAALANAAGGGISSLANFASGAPADAAVASQLGNVANDGTAAAVQASNDAALNATDGGAAGAAAGQGAGLASDVGTALGALGAGYSLYNTVNNWQSGNTGSDALNGAETGASIGTMIVPGIGTVIGGLLGGAVGAASSAFGGGEHDPETTTWNKVAQAAQSNPSLFAGMSPSQLYQNLAGVMDAKNNSAGHSQPIEQVFGREGEGNLMDQLTGYLNQQYQAGGIKPGESIANQWSQTIAPWLASKNASIANQNTSSGTPEAPALTQDLQGLVSDWENGAFGAQTPMGISGQTIGGLANYAGLSPTQLAALNAASQPSQVLQNFGNFRRGLGGISNIPASMHPSVGATPSAQPWMGTPLSYGRIA